MPRTRRGRSGSYIGPVEVLIDGAVVATGQASLSGNMVELDATGLDGVEQWIEGTGSWNGRLSGVDAGALLRETLVLRLPNGREGEALLRSNDGRLTGSGPPPFDLT